MSATTRTLSEPQIALLRQAAEWRLLALLFESPREGWHDEVAALARDVDDGGLRAAAEAASREASPGVHTSIFGPGGPVSPREVTYLGGIHLGYLLAELRAYYEAFAYHPDTPEPADHVAVEAGFVAYLLIKQAYALASDDADHAAVVADAIEQFSRDHLAAMAQPVATTLEAVGPPYLVGAAAALLARVGPPAATTVPGALPMVDVEGEEVCCGAGDEDEAAEAAVWPRA
ncbi:MAG: molecular chaperone TorD family protein [Acidobacteria bacterium]|nr:molecular chaperone TorD family protein [Acidobacteriota bacterium]